MTVSLGLAYFAVCSIIFFYSLLDRPPLRDLTLSHKIQNIFRYKRLDQRVLSHDWRLVRRQELARRSLKQGPDVFAAELGGMIAESSQDAVAFATCLSRRRYYRELLLLLVAFVCLYVTRNGENVEPLVV